MSETPQEDQQTVHRRGIQRRLAPSPPPWKEDYLAKRRAAKSQPPPVWKRWCRQTERLRCTAVLGSRYLFVGDWGSPVFGDVVAGTAGLTSSGLHGCTAGRAGGRCCWTGVLRGTSCRSGA